ncbi:hypothetical protein ASF99_04970 [Exiguobacterium sp. Leaf187]|uniref:hypothetical protein n=1 Tax=Exiguobacterium sp. Leaf187 TaxID=1736294 RepID=UPI0006F70F63|nr:hypothetical protein [Exiguobacterium sp. Leaf187]KQS19241.1 hypothetical protein ASF99_04970 [Exiguobacterium sp. Leaf187]
MDYSGNEKMLLKTNDGLIPLKGCWSEELGAYVLFVNNEIESGISETNLWHSSLKKLIDAAE